jgi:hypothetical protein
MGLILNLAALETEELPCWILKPHNRDASYESNWGYHHWGQSLYSLQPIPFNL